MATYSHKVQTAIAQSPKTLGSQLGRWAVHRGFPITKLAKATGATRQTLYNWFAGGNVTQAYQERVREILDVLKSSPTEEDAWKKICSRYEIRSK